MVVEYPVYYPDGLPPANAPAPAWLFWARLSDGVRFASGPPLVPCGYAGVYKFAWDAGRDGGAHGLIDWGASLDAPVRYTPAGSFPETERMLTAAQAAPSSFVGVVTG